MSKLSRLSIQVALVGAVAIIGAATMPAHAGLSSNALVANGLSANALQSNAIAANAINPNALSLLGLIDNTQTQSGTSAAGPSALESLNGVAVEAVILPPEAGR